MKKPLQYLLNCIFISPATFLQSHVLHLRFRLEPFVPLYNAHSEMPLDVILREKWSSKKLRGNLGWSTSIVLAPPLS